MKLRISSKCALSALAIMASCAFAGQAAAADAAPTGNAKAAMGKTSMCIGCQGIPGYKASFPEVSHVPKIAGKNAQYIIAALKESAMGDRTFPAQATIPKQTPRK